MTIALGFNCIGGVVLCADQQIGASGWHKFNESKMYVINNPTEPLYTIVLTYAGDPSVMKTFHQKFAGVVSANKAFSSVRNLQTLLEGCLLDMNQDAVNSTDLLCGVSVQGGTYGLLRTKGYSVYEIGDYDQIGVGDSSLVRFLSQMLVSHPMKVYPAVYIGNYIVKKAKEFVDGCGGETDILILRGDGKCMPPWFKETEKSEQAGEAIEHDVKRLLWMVANAEDQGRIDAFWDDLKIRVKDFTGVGQ